MSGIDIGDGECVVSMDSFLLVGIGSYKRSFTSESKVLVALVGSHAEGINLEKSLDKETENKESLNETFNNCVF